MELKQFYQEIGADCDTVVKRMGLTERHLKKYLRKFMDNLEYGKLSKAVAEHDYVNVEWAAHTLKGVTSNLGLDILYEDLQRIVDSVRGGREQEVSSLFEAADRDYRMVMELLAEVDLEN